MNKMEKALHELSEMDDLAAQDSPIHRLHPAAKLLATIAYILLVVSFDILQAPDRAAAGDGRGPL